MKVPDIEGAAHPPLQLYPRTNDTKVSPGEFSRRERIFDVAASLWGQRRKEDLRRNVVKAGMKVANYYYRGNSVPTRTDRSVDRSVSRWPCFR